MVTHVSEVLIVSRSRTFCNKGFEIIDSFLLSIVCEKSIPMRNDKLSMRLYNCENILLCSKIKKITKISKHHSIVNKETWRERGGNGLC